MIRTWRLDDARQTLVLACEGGLAEVVYWDAPLPADEDLAGLVAAAQRGFTGGMLDVPASVSLCPEAARGFPGQPGLIAYQDGRLLQPRFAFETDAREGDALALTFADADLGMRLSVQFARLGDVFTAHSTLTSERPIVLHHLAAPVLPGPDSGSVLHFSGRWIGEFQPQRWQWGPGILKREARTGRSGHEHPPFALFLEEGASNCQGRVHAMHYAHSGGHVMFAEELPDGRRQIQWGHATGSEAAGTEFTTASVFFTRSDAGMNGCATAFQRTLRDHVIDWPRSVQARPVHYNCWEAVYFNQDLVNLKDIAARAADLGAERFVLDDGWFGRRDDDTSSLGDWWIDTCKWPDGLGPLIDHVHRLGMTFGLWFEPEMVNPNSDLCRAHPDWVLGPPDQVMGRSQLVLDMARADVRDYLFDKISEVLAAHAIDYVKWDHNRVLPVADAAQTRGTYLLLDRFRKAFPEVEIESCASGGGRIDFGILSHTHRVWLSDSNDALERLRMQHEAALFLPMVVTGSHVGPRTCHTSGRLYDIGFRAWVAAQRHMGLEMDPRELTEDEVDVLRAATRWWKANREWMSMADILRLDHSDRAIIAEQHMGKDRFAVFAGRMAASGQISPRPLRLAGLVPDTHYQITLANRGDISHLSRGGLALRDGPVTLTGAALMQSGLNLPWSLPERMWVLEGKAIEGKHD